MQTPFSAVDAALPRVSIVFLAFERRDELAASLTAVVHELDYPADRLELVVVDNASTDGTAEMVRSRFGQAELIRLAQNVGVSGINAGMRRATGDWILLLDDDCQVSGDDLRVAVEAAQAHDAGLVSFRVVSPKGAVFNESYDPGLFAFWGCAVLLRGDVARVVGGYDPRIFFWGNELELTARVLDAGFTHLFLPEVQPVHRKEPSPPLPFDLRPAMINMRHWAYAAGKLLRPGDALAVLVRLLLRSVLDAVLFSPSALRVLPEVLAGFADGFRRRRPVRRAVSVAYRRYSLEFLDPLDFVRGPVARLRTRGDAERAQREFEERYRERVARSARFYPRGTAALRL